MWLFGQSYSELWKKANEAEQKDLPQTQYEVLQKIVTKAEQEKAYGQLLKAELNAAQEENAQQAKTINKQSKSVKKFEKNWENASEAVGSFGSALSSIGQATQDEGLNVAGVIAQAIAEIALGAGKAIAQASELGPWGWIAFGAMAMAQLAAMVAQVNSITSHAGGGFIPGNSYSGDKRLARVNSGELVLNSS